MTTLCPGCARHFETTRALTAHLSGCARLTTWNAATTHHAANAALQRLARRCLVEATNEPRFHSYTAPADADEGHLLGPDLTLFLRPPLTIDLKGYSPSCVSHAFQRLSAIEAQKEAKSRELYEEHVRALHEDFEVIAFNYVGGFNKKFTDVVKRLIFGTPWNYEEEITAISVAIQTAHGRSLLNCR